MSHTDPVQDSFLSILKQSTNALIDGHNDIAIELLKSALTSSDCDDQIMAEMYAHLSQAHFNRGENPESERYARLAVEKDESNIRWWYKLFRMGNTTSADIVRIREVLNKDYSQHKYEQYLQQKLKDIFNQNDTPTHYKWYQTNTEIVICVAFENACLQKCSFQMKNDRQIKLHVERLEEQEGVRFRDVDIKLSGSVDKRKVDIKVTNLNVEYRLLKSVANQHWNELEHDDIKQKTTKKNWDKIAEELDEDLKKQGIDDKEDINDFFQKIYAQGTPETKMAMMKSFQESGGTVLSTDWNDISKKKTPIKPPDGMEFKRWDE